MPEFVSEVWKTNSEGEMWGTVTDGVTSSRHVGGGIKSLAESCLRNSAHKQGCTVIGTVFLFLSSLPCVRERRADSTPEDPRPVLGVCPFTN